MDKLITPKFGLFLLLAMVLLIVHEYGHYIAYRLMGYQACVRKSIIAPGIDPKT